MVITPKNKTGNKKTSVIITDYSPLTENLIDLLKDIRPDFSWVNGDQEQCKYTFLTTLQPRILILDPGFICNAENKLMQIIKSDLPNTHVIFLTFYESGAYHHFLQNTGINGMIIRWQDYKKLPLLMHSILNHDKKITSII